MSGLRARSAGSVLNREDHSLGTDASGTTQQICSSSGSARPQLTARSTASRSAVALLADDGVNSMTRRPVRLM
jgi:hypothetical protein